MTHVVDLGNGDCAEIRDDLNYSDRKWWRIKVDEAKRASGTGKPAETKVNPDKPSEMITVPAVPAELTMAGNIGLIEELTARLLTAWPLPLPWTPERADELAASHGFEAVDAIEGAIIEQMNRLNGVAAPKRQKDGESSATSSSDEASPQGEPSPEPSSTPPA